MLYQTKSSMDNKEMTDKLSEEDINTVKQEISDAEEWFDLNKDTCTKDEIDTKQKHLQDTLSPIMTKLMPQQEGSPDMPDMNNNVPEQGPTIDEVD